MMLAIVLVLAAAQTDSINAEALTDPFRLCGQPITDANASGIVSFPLDYQNPSSQQDLPANEPSWVITVTADQNAKSVSKSFWYDPAGRNYSSMPELSYDACALIISRFPENSVRLAQGDSGDCTSVFTPQSIDALTSRATKYIKQILGPNAPSGGNLTMDRMPNMCSSIADALKDDGLAYPTECAQEFGLSKTDSRVGVLTAQRILTGYPNATSPGLNGSCTVQHGINNTLTLVSGTTTAPETYANATRALHAILEVYMATSNFDRSFTGWANATLRCLRAGNISQGSRVPQRLPAGKPYTWSASASPLSPEAKGGIIAGALLGVGIPAAALTCWWRSRRRKRQHEGLSSARPLGGQRDARGVQMSEADGAAQVHELSPEYRKAELGGSQVMELGSGQEKSEKSEKVGAHELAAD